MNKQVRWMGLLAAFGVQSLAVAASAERVTPPPGMYEVEVKADDYTLAGMGSRSMCIKPMQAITLPKDMLANGCTLTKGQVVSGQVLMQLSCPWNRTTTKTRKVNDKTWETSVDTITQRGQDRIDIAGSMAQMRYMAQQLVRLGNEEERAEANDFLADARHLEARLKQAAPPPMSSKVADLMASKTGTRSVLVHRLTRIGDCKG